MRSFRFRFLLPLLMVLLASCAQTAIAPASTPPPSLSLQARSYLTTALDIMQQHSVNRKKINWTTLRRQTFAWANGATTPAGTYLAIQAALAALNDHHSTFVLPNETAVYGSTAALTSSEKPQGHLLAHDIGCLELPTYNRVPTVPASTDYVLLAQDAIRRADQAGACGWIVDLLTDTGGDSWPMLAAVGPVLGEGVVGWFVDPDGVKTAWSYAAGQAQLGGKTVLGIEHAYRLTHPAPAGKCPTK